jgi:hypothetical protein
MNCFRAKESFLISCNRNHGFFEPMDKVNREFKRKIGQKKEELNVSPLEVRRIREKTHKLMHRPHF